MPVKTYTLPQLEGLWNDYAVAFACRWLVQGKWEWEKPPEKQVATRAERVKIKEHKTFIEYLKEKG
jgi:hypothetical protein